MEHLYKREKIAFPESLDWWTLEIAAGKMPQGLTRD